MLCFALPGSVYTKFGTDPFTFPLFMLSYVPIVIHSLFVTPEWTHIDHTRTLDVQQICAGQYRDAV